MESILGVSLFSHIGQQILSIDDFKCEFVPSMCDVIKFIDGMKWDNIRLEEVGIISTFLSRNKIDKEWNSYVAAAKAEIEPFVATKVEVLTYPSEIITSIIKNVKYDFVGITMSMVYQGFIHSEFYERMFLIYKSGHLPCGWHGKPDKGHFLIH